MKKYIVAGIIVVLVGLYILFANMHDETPLVGNIPSSTPIVTGTPDATGGGIAGMPPTPTPSAPGNGGNTGQAGQYKDGTYTGPVTNAFYGNIQVVATVQGGVITSVSVPVYPNAPGHTSEVTNVAIPLLKQEAVQAQSANVNIVSGATQDSQAFQESLAAALAQTKS
jgi:uncharacterized protein with FMN-binding domain